MLKGLSVFMRCCFRCVFLCVLVMVAGCAQQAGRFQLKDLAKSDVDLVADLHRQAVFSALKDLNTKLYRLNPVQISRGAEYSVAARIGSKPLSEPQASKDWIEARWQQLEASQGGLYGFEELSNTRSIESMRLAFDEGFHGDRVFALMAGLYGMFDEAYGFKREFYLLDSVEGQKLYNSARNVEVMVWLLRSKRASDGSPLLFSDSMSAEVVNLSFERLFGKLIAHQDMMSKIMQGQTQRAVNTVAHGLVSMTFIPL
ncbi:MAG: hypothetical protein ACRBBW_16950 [Cellvibrionaceae bacterium]